MGVHGMSVPTEAVLDQMADAAIYADRGGKIQLWNRAAAALFGYEAAEALGNSIDIIVPNACASRTGAALRPLWRAVR